jgi:hypothetical protein
MLGDVLKQFITNYGKAVPNGKTCNKWQNQINDLPQAIVLKGSILCDVTTAGGEYQGFTIIHKVAIFAIPIHFPFWLNFQFSIFQFWEVFYRCILGGFPW